MTIAKGEIDNADRCQASAVPFIVDRQIALYYFRLYDVSLAQRPSSMPLRRILPLLSCPLCAVDRGGSSYPLLRNPFTLHCGHTVCSTHLQTLDPAQRCPLPVCSSATDPNTARPNIPSSSRVIYLPARPPPPSARRSTSTSADQLEQRVDITISKLIEVVSRHSQLPPPTSNPGGSDLSDGDGHGQSPPRATLPSSDEETEFYAMRVLDRASGQRRRRRPRLAPELDSQSTVPNHSESTLTSAGPIRKTSADPAGDALPSPSGHSGRSYPPSPRTAGGECSDGDDLGPEPPRKRPKRDARSLVTDRETESRAIEPEAETNNSDVPNHQSANIPDLGRPDAVVRQDPEGTEENLRTRIDKELLTELSCEICFTIYYQPVTTPCQHVSCLLFFFFSFRKLSAFYHFTFHPTLPELHRTFCGNDADATPIALRFFHPKRFIVRSGCFHSILADVLHSWKSSNLTALFERRSAGDAFKGLWTTGVTVLFAGQISLIMDTCLTPLKTRSSCR